MLESCNCSEPLPKTIDYYFVLFLFRLTEQIPCRCVRNSLPGIVSPITVHPIDIGSINALRIAPENITVHVCNGKVEKHINAAHLPRRLNYFPSQMQSIGIQQAQAPS